MRLFKYLLNDYYEEFCTNVRDWANTVDIVEHDEAHLDRGEDVHRLRALYTDHVVLDRMVALWNNGVDNLSHMLAVGADLVASRQALVDQFAAFIVEHLLTPDEKPTLTRFFTFRVTSPLVCQSRLAARS